MEHLGGPARAKRRAVMVLLATGTPCASNAYCVWPSLCGGASESVFDAVVLCAGVALAAMVLAVAGVVVHHNMHRSAMLSKNGPVYPVGEEPAGLVMPPHHTQHLNQQQLVNSEDQQPEDEQPEPEPEQEEPVDTVAEKMHQYEMFHPVYNRCQKSANLHEFTAAITQSCGNVHELETCSYSCTSVMRQWSAKMGCCFETVMDAYKFADPATEHAWRMWQGTMSGKCGVTFEGDNCGESVGQHGYDKLEKSVDSLKKTASQNQWDIENIEDQVNYNNQYYDSYYDPYAYGGSPSYGSYNSYDPSYKDYDDYYDSTDFYGDNYKYPAGSTMVPPSHYKGNGAQSMAHADHGPANGKRGLGDEVSIHIEKLFLVNI